MAFCLTSAPNVNSVGASRLGTNGKVLLVGKHQKHSLSQLVFVQHALQLLSGLDDTIAIVAINDEDDALGILEVMPPQWPDLVLPADIPDGKLNILVFDGLDVEAWKQSSRQHPHRCGSRGGLTDCWNRGNNFTELELVEDSRLSSGIETDHQNSHLLLPP
jgi:hypothetical protein